MLEYYFVDDKAAAFYNNNLNYQTEGSSGIDLRACNVVQKNESCNMPNGYLLLTGCSVLVLTGIKVRMCIPDQFQELNFSMEIQVRPRSGLALKNQITVLNTPGTVDYDYRGEIGVILYNAGDAFSINLGERIAQMVVTPIIKPRIRLITECNFNNTNRGASGFGSTGTL
jgi:dUTP pyrophosphatase